MTKLKKDQIVETDLLEYLTSYSDFSFELSVLRMLRERNIECEHGGHYEDPVTNKSREFDIRATKTIKRSRVRMAIECKNIRENFPILVSCIPRQEQESYHQIALVSDPETDPHMMIAMNPFQSRATALSIRDPHSLYRVNDPVGKSTVQVGRVLDNTISANDSELYDKWGQCLSSANDLVSRVNRDGRGDKASYFSAVFPFVVVPNGRLWIVTYDNNGNRVCDPAPSDRVSCFIDKDYDMGNKIAGTTMWLSHVEIVTFDGLITFIDQYLSTEERMARIFSKEGMTDAHMRSFKKKTYRDRDGHR